jgi:CPA2 family monovalent cation:H+ antiporter-2
MAMTNEVGALGELLLLTSVSLVVLLLLQRLKMPAAVGFIATGVLVGPGGLGLVRDIGLVRTLADLGVMFLLFTVGLQFSRQELIRFGRPALVGGFLQVALTGGAVAAVALLAGFHPAQAIFFGMLGSLSSTALVLRLLTDRLELTSPHGRLATGVLVFQDLLVIVFAVAVPWLSRWYAGQPAQAGGSISILSTLAQLTAVALLFALAQRVVPWLLTRALRTRAHEAFLFGVVVVALGSALLTAQLGLSVALGAFLAGMILADSDLRSQVEVGVVSFRDALTGVFFVAIGMLFDPRIVMAHPTLVLASTLGLVVIKIAAASVALRWAGTPWRVALATGVTLAQVGEFSFVLAASSPAPLLGQVGAEAFFAGAVFSLLLTPFLVNRAAEWSHAVAGRAGPKGSTPAGASHEAEFANHVVIAGFGLNGRNVARVLRAVRLPHVVLDLNPDSLQSEAAHGSPLLLGDIAHPDIQRRAGVPRARVLVLALSDPVATRHACRIARSLSSGVFIIARTRYVAEIDELHRLGANQVIPEEFETSIEIFTATLRHFHVPSNVVQAQVQLLREERYSLLRGLKLPGSVVEQLDTILRQGTCDTFLLLQHSPAVGRTLGELELLHDQGEAKVVAVVRGGAASTAPTANMRLQVGDILVMTGTHAAMEEAFRTLSPDHPA